jgi:hypothetical protein
LCIARILPIKAKKVNIPKWPNGQIILFLASSLKEALMSGQVCLTAKQLLHSVLV